MTEVSLLLLSKAEIENAVAQEKTIDQGLSQVLKHKNLRKLIDL